MKYQGASVRARLFICGMKKMLWRYPPVGVQRIREQ